MVYAERRARKVPLTEFIADEAAGILAEVEVDTWPGSRQPKVETVRSKISERWRTDKGQPKR